MTNWVDHPGSERKIIPPDWNQNQISALPADISKIWRRTSGIISGLMQEEGNKIDISGDDKLWIDFASSQAKNMELSERQRTYYRRILRVHSMPDLTQQKWNPVNMISQALVDSVYFRDFDFIRIPEVVDEYTTFDLFNFPNDHVARRPSDSYFIQKDYNNPRDSMLLRPHISVMWKYIMNDFGWIGVLRNGWKLQVLSSGKVYRVDEIDPTHHECFHQIDWLKVTNKQDELITQDTLRELLINIIHSIFWNNINYRFLKDQFPYTQDSLQVEVEFEWKWLEVLWAGIVHPSVMEKLWLDSSKYNGWAFWFGIERLAMALKKIPDIRLFWSQDERITKQWWNYEAFKEVSNYPPVYKDISFITPKTKFQRNEEESNSSWTTKLMNEADLFDIAWIVRDISWDLVEEVRCVDIFESNARFGDDKKSISIRIIFRSLEKTLKNDEINEMYFRIREKIETELGYTLR